MYKNFDVQRKNGLTTSEFWNGCNWRYPEENRKYKKIIRNGNEAVKKKSLLLVKYKKYCKREEGNRSLTQNLIIVHLLTYSWS